jgi:hypothetical protein
MLFRKGPSLALVAVTISLLLSACGASSADTGGAPAAPAPSNPSPAVIEGIATPSSVAVVTATNAN